MLLKGKLSSIINLSKNLNAKTKNYANLIFKRYLADSNINNNKKNKVSSNNRVIEKELSNSNFIKQRSEYANEIETNKIKIENKEDIKISPEENYNYNNLNDGITLDEEKVILRNKNNQFDGVNTGNNYNTEHYFIPERLNFREVETPERANLLTSTHYFNQLKFLTENNNNNNNNFNSAPYNFIPHNSVLEAPLNSINKIHQIVLTDVINRMKINKDSVLISNHIKVLKGKSYLDYSQEQKNLKELKNNLVQLGILFNTNYFNYLESKELIQTAIKVLKELSNKNSLIKGHRTVYFDTKQKRILEKSMVDSIGEMSESLYIKFKINKETIESFIDKAEISLGSYYENPESINKSNEKNNSEEVVSMKTRKGRKRVEEKVDLKINITNTDDYNSNHLKALLSSSNTELFLIGFMTEPWQYIGIKALEICNDSEYIAFRIKKGVNLISSKNKNSNENTIYICMKRRYPEVIKRMGLRVTASKKVSDVEELFSTNGVNLTNYLEAIDPVYDRKLKLVSSLIEDKSFEDWVKNDIGRDKVKDNTPILIINPNYYGSGINVLCPGHSKLAEKICSENGIHDNKGYLNNDLEAIGLEKFSPRSITNEYIITQLTNKSALLGVSQHLYQKFINKDTQEKVIVRTVPTLKIPLSNDFKKNILEKLRGCEMIPPGLFESKNVKINKNSFEFTEEVSLYKNIVEELDLMSNYNLIETNDEGREINTYLDDTINEENNFNLKEDSSNNHSDNFNEKSDITVIPILVDSLSNEIIFNLDLIEELYIYKLENRISWVDINLKEIKHILEKYNINTETDNITKGYFNFTSDYLKSLDWLFIKNALKFELETIMKIKDEQNNKEKDGIEFNSILKNRSIQQLLNISEYIKTSSLNNQTQSTKQNVHLFLNGLFSSKKLINEITEKINDLYKNIYDGQKALNNSNKNNYDDTIVVSDIIIDKKIAHRSSFLSNAVLGCILNNQLPYASIKTIGDVLNKKGEVSPINFKDVLEGIEIFDFFKLQDTINNIGDTDMNEIQDLQNSKNFGYGADAIRLVLSANDLDKDMVLIESDLMQAKNDLRSMRRISRQFSLLWFLYKENMKDYIQKKSLKIKDIGADKSSVEEIINTDLMKFYNSSTDILGEFCFNFSDLSLYDQWMVFNFLSYVERISKHGSLPEKVIFKNYLNLNLEFIKENLNNYIIASLRKLNEMSEEIESLENKIKNEDKQKSKDNTLIEDLSKQINSQEKKYLNLLNAITWLSCKIFTTALTLMTPFSPFNTQFIYEKLYLTSFKQKYQDNNYENVSKELALTNLKVVEVEKFKQMIGLNHETLVSKTFKFNYFSKLKVMVKKIAISAAKFNKVPIKDLTIALITNSGEFDEIILINNQNELKWFFDVGKVVIYKNKSEIDKQIYNQLLDKLIRVELPKRLENETVTIEELKELDPLQKSPYNSGIISEDSIVVKINCYVLLEKSYIQPYMEKHEYTESVFREPYEKESNKKVEHFNVDIQNQNKLH